MSVNRAFLSMLPGIALGRNVGISGKGDARTGSTQDTERRSKGAAEG